MNLGFLLMSGGLSSRMGSPKALLQLRGQPLLYHIARAGEGFSERLLSVNNDAIPTPEGFLRVGDIYKECGPMGGLHASLSATTCDALVVAPCDAPYFSAEAAAFLASEFHEELDAVILEDETGRTQPMMGVYSKSCLPALTEHLEEKRFKLMMMLSQLRVKRVRLPRHMVQVTQNLNTPEDYQALVREALAEDIRRFSSTAGTSDVIEPERVAYWKQEEQAAHMIGWDFSHIAGRYSEADGLPWDYRQTILKYLTPDMRILDIDTGGGEFLLSLGHPHALTAATEAYPPNVELCSHKLLPLGIDFRAADGKGPLPFPDAQFDMVIDRHGDFNAQEIARVLKPGALFITQQVGAQNDRELVALLLGDVPLPFPDQTLAITKERFMDAGFSILEEGEVFRPIRFYDVGALVWFARIIEWEFPGFSVDSCLDRLTKAHRQIQAQCCVEGSIHRFMLVAEKK